MSFWWWSMSRVCSKSAASPWPHNDEFDELRDEPVEQERGGVMKTCLVVDDSSVIRKVARRILERLEFQILEAEDGEQALDACKRQLPEAILLDWNMPKMDGYEFLRMLRRLPGGDGPKVVFCTTENDVAHIARALHAGADEYIMKPFDKEIVEAKFQEVGLL
jgi:two-component system chemotaxis response regulator CheY